MANTVSLLNYTNTFGDLLASQNRAAIELNNLGANNYTKDTGTLFLNGSGTGLSVTNAGLLGSAIVSGVLSVGGSISAVSNVFINGIGNGLEVANNSLLRGNIVTNSITANTSIVANNIQSNIGLSSPTLIVSGNTLSNTITANSIITTPIINVTSKLDANAAPISYFNNIVTSGQLSVGGNFVINGATVYSTNTFTLNAGSSIGLDSSYIVNRGLTGANAAIRWNEAQDYWDIVDVNNPTSYSKILTANLISSSLTSTSTDTFASSLAANTLDTKIVTANTSMKSYVDNANTSMKAYVDSNVSSLQSQFSSNVSFSAAVNAWQNTRIDSAFTTANGANGLAAGAYAAANTNSSNLSANISYIQSIDNTQNTRIQSLETVNLNQNTSISIIQGVDNTQNTNITAVNNFAAGAYNTANGANGLAAGAYNTANNRVSSITGTTNQITVTGTLTPTLSLPQSIATTSSVQFGSFGVGVAATGTSGEIIATNNITAYYSDDRLKTKLGNIENALEKVMSLNGFYHEANETAQALGYTPIREVGVSAQEVNKVLPEVVAPAPIDPQYMTVRYERLVPLLIEAIKELKAEIDSIKNPK